MDPTDHPDQLDHLDHLIQSNNSDRLVQSVDSVQLDHSIEPDRTIQAEHKSKLLIELDDLNSPDSNMDDKFTITSSCSVDATLVSDGCHVRRRMKSSTEASFDAEGIVEKKTTSSVSERAIVKDVEVSETASDRVLKNLVELDEQVVNSKKPPNSLSLLASAASLQQQQQLQQLFCLDPSPSSTTTDLLSMPSFALDKMEEMAEFARTAWVGCSTTDLMTMPCRARDKAEEIARHAEEFARHAWEESTTELMAMPGRARGKAGEIARHASAELRTIPSRARDKAEEIAHQAEDIARQAWLRGRTLMEHHHLPNWMRDNDFLVRGHRPQLNSFVACFRSIFSIHTETGNIWTHLIGCIAFIVVATFFLMRPSIEVQWQDKAVFSAFFAGAILCLGFSCLFHTVFCHSEKVGRFFSKLDYCGIALLIMGSFVPWLYYSFYCRLSPQITYLALVITLGIICIIISMWDKFGEPAYRPVRAGLFVALGLTGIVPCAHYIITDGFYHAVNFAALGWLGLVGGLYICGAALYATRFPECAWPGKFDIWFQSHQIFHVFVVLAAFIHYYGMSQVAYNRLTYGGCQEDSEESASVCSNANIPCLSSD